MDLGSVGWFSGIAGSLDVEFEVDGVVLVNGVVGVVGMCFGHGRSRRLLNLLVVIVLHEPSSAVMFLSIRATLAWSFSTVVNARRSRLLPSGQGSTFMFKLGSQLLDATLIPWLGRQRSKGRSNKAAARCAHADAPSMIWSLIDPSWSVCSLICRPFLRASSLVRSTAYSCKKRSS